MLEENKLTHIRVCKLTCLITGAFAIIYIYSLVISPKIIEAVASHLYLCNRGSLRVSRGARAK